MQQNWLNIIDSLPHGLLIVKEEKEDLKVVYSNTQSETIISKYLQ